MATNSTSTSTEGIPFSAPSNWDSHAHQYNDAVGKSSSLGAAFLISLVQAQDPPLSALDARVIDLGAGTGSLAFQLANIYPELPILATDIAPGMLDQIVTNPLKTPNIGVQIADMCAPVGGEAVEGVFSHVFSTMAIQFLHDPVGEGTLAEWARLLKPDGLVAIGVWDFDQPCGPHTIWAEAATAVDPNYVNPPMQKAGHWVGLAHLKEGLLAAGFRDVKSESRQVGFNIGKEGFIRFFWESKNPMPLDRQASFKGDLTKVRIEMERLLDEVYDGGKSISLGVGLAVGRKPKLD